MYQDMPDRRSIILRLSAVARGGMRRYCFYVLAFEKKHTTAPFRTSIPLIYPLATLKSLALSLTKNGIV